MAAPATYVFNGKEFTAWSPDQLGAINRDALKKRAMDLRDQVGQDRLPAMPHHPEGMRAWILEVQSVLMGHEVRSEAPSSASSQGGRGGGQPASRGGVPPEGLNEDQQAYWEANNAAEAARQRNRGSGIF